LEGIVEADELEWAIEATASGDANPAKLILARLGATGVQRARIQALTLLAGKRTQRTRDLLRALDALDEALDIADRDYARRE
jgi:hypothetical protein